MNLAEVENVFGTLSPLQVSEKKNSIIPILLIVCVVGIAIVIVNDANKTEVQIVNNTKEKDS